MTGLAEADIATTHPPKGKLFRRLLTRAWEFDFFQAVWLLECCFRERTAVGGRGPVSEEPLQFRPNVLMSFPPTDVRRVSELRRLHGGQPYYLMDVTFMGLYGVCTPLPLHYAVDILRAVDPYTAKAHEPGPEVGADRLQPEEGEPESAPVRDFLDIFHHRLISMFYRSWTKYRYDKSFSMPGRDTITEHLLWLIGCLRGYDEAALGVSPIRLLRYAGLLTHHPKPAVSLEGLLSDYWHGIAVQVEQCVGRWIALVEADLNRLGKANSRLGVDLTIGEQVYDLSGAFNVVLGPMDWTTYLFFLPGEWGYEQTHSLVQLYCSDPLAFTIEVKLEAREVPETRLSSDGETCRLGFTSWVRTEEAPVPETSVTFSAARKMGAEEVGVESESVFAEAPAGASGV
ncbi:MAG: type VI secretion system baseplate subunit TssG [Phycisphaerae bacterium]|nr:type VI secretion system baseplate subunit TssG [Phycisphaerae bacterium]